LRVAVTARCTRPHSAADLLHAERSATTSGEALSNTGVVLKNVLDGDRVDGTLRAQVQAVCDEGARIWADGR
jgi:hypothetical protein